MSIQNIMVRKETANRAHVKHLSHSGSGIVMAINVAVTANNTPTRSSTGAIVGNFVLTNLPTKRKVKEHMIERLRKWKASGSLVCRDCRAISTAVGKQKPIIIMAQSRFLCCWPTGWAGSGWRQFWSIWTAIGWGKSWNIFVNTTKQKALKRRKASIWWLDRKNTAK